MAKFLATKMRLPVALLDRPWNQADTEAAQFTRYYHWQEIGAAFAR
jgi:hypothetical protein